MINGDNNRVMAAFPLHDGQIRVIVDNGTLTPEEHNALKPEDLTLEKFTTLAQAIVGPNIKFQPKDSSWLTYYRVNERHAEHFDYKGRIFLAGDASHVHSPVGGQGKINNKTDHPLATNKTKAEAFASQNLLHQPN